MSFTAVHHRHPFLPVLTRRRWIQLTGACLAWASASPRANLSSAGPLKIGVESTLFLSGLAHHLQQGVGQDLGLAINFTPGPGLTLLDQLGAGQIDVALTQTYDRALGLEQHGLAFNGRTIATGRYVLAGTNVDAAAVKGRTDIVQALSEIARVGEQGGCSFVNTSEPSGTSEMEKALWKAVGPRPLGAWMRSATADPLGALKLLKQLDAQHQSAYCLVEYGLWQSQNTHPLVIRLDGDPRLAAPCRVASSYHSAHPAAKFICGYWAGENGQHMVESFGHGYHL